MPYWIWGMIWSLQVSSLGNRHTLTRRYKFRLGHLTKSQKIAQSPGHAAKPAYSSRRLLLYLPASALGLWGNWKVNKTTMAQPLNCKWGEKQISVTQGKKPRRFIHIQSEKRKVNRAAHLNTNKINRKGMAVIQVYNI